MDEIQLLTQALFNSVIKMEGRETVLTVAEANRLRRIVAAALDMSDQELAKKLADYHRRQTTQLKAEPSDKNDTEASDVTPPDQVKAYVNVNRCWN